MENRVEPGLSNGDVMEILSVDLVSNVGKLDNIVKFDFFISLSNLEVNAARFITNSSTVDLVFTFTRDLYFEDLLFFYVENYFVFFYVIQNISKIISYLADDNLSRSARLQMSNLGRSWERLESLGINFI